ncbi:hypothetical protein JCM11641_001280 [Rhodosporidiobolus odoratus]
MKWKLKRNKKKALTHRPSASKVRTKKKPKASPVLLATLDPGSGLERDDFGTIKLEVQETKLTARLVVPKKKTDLPSDKSKAAKHLSAAQRRTIDELFSYTLFLRLASTPPNVEHDLGQIDLRKYGTSGLLPDANGLQYLFELGYNNLGLEAELDNPSAMRMSANFSTRHSSFASSAIKHARCAIAVELNLGKPGKKQSVDWLPSAKHDARVAKTADWMLSEFWGTPSSTNPSVLARSSLFTHTLVQDMAGHILGLSLTKTIPRGVIEYTLDNAIVATVDNPFPIAFAATTFSYTDRYVAAHNRLEAISGDRTSEDMEGKLIDAVISAGKLFVGAQTPRKGVSSGSLPANTVKEEFE